MQHINCIVNNLVLKMANYKLFVESVQRVCPENSNAVLAAYAPRLEAEDGVGNKYETLKEMAVWLLVEGNALNQIHWNVDKMVKHTLLNEAYDLCRDAGDKLAETYMALTNKPCDKEFPSSPKSIDLDDKAVLELLKYIDKHMNDAVKKNENFPEGVKNIFADFDEAMTTIIYKYQQFTA